MQRIIWTQALQFAALQEGWAIVRYGSTDQRASLVNYVDFRNIMIARFATASDALIHVQSNAVTPNGLHATALAFLRQQTINQEKGAWEPSCGKDGLALQRFYHRKAKEGRDAYRVGNHVPIHQQVTKSPLISFSEWDQHDAAKEGWVLYQSPLARVMPRTCDTTIHKTDEDAEKFVEQCAERDRFHDRLDTLHLRAIEFRDRWLKDGPEAARYAHWGRNAKKRAEHYLGPLMLIGAWYNSGKLVPIADETKGEKVVTNDEGERVVLTAEQLKPLPSPIIMRKPVHE